MADPTDAASPSNGKSESNADLLKELVAHLSANRTQGVPNMIALVRSTAERYAAAA